MSGPSEKVLFIEENSNVYMDIPMSFNSCTEVRPFGRSFWGLVELICVYTYEFQKLHSEF